MTLLSYFHTGGVSRLASRWLRYSIGIALLGLCPAQASGQSGQIFTEEEVAWIHANPIVRVAIEPQFRPLEYIEHGVHKGLSAGYLQAISEITGLKFESVVVPWGKAAAALDAQEVDLLPAVYRDHSPANLQGRIVATSPYFVGATAVVTRDRGAVVFDARRLEGRTVALRSGGPLHHAFRERFPEIRLLLVDSTEASFDAVIEGSADASVGADAVLLSLMRRKYYGQLHVSGTIAELPVQLAMGARKDLPLLASIVDKSLNSLTAKETDGIVNQWIEGADYGEPTLHAVLQYYGPQVAALATLIVTFALLAGVAWRSRIAAARSERAKAMFLAVMGHEIRTPMHTILSSVELLQRTRLDSDQSKLAASAGIASEALMSLLDQILQFSKLEAGKVMPELIPTPIWPWLTESVEILRARAAEKGLQLSVAIHCSPTLVLEIDPTRLRQVLLNLLSNAIKFSESGTVAVTMSYKAGRPALPNEDARRGMLVLEVHDNGVGMSSAELRRVFEPFEQGNPSTTRRFGGTGLGLTICRELVALMGGRISVRSEPNVLTSFTVSVPVVHVGYEPELADGSSHQPVATAPSQADLSESPHPQGELGPTRDLQLLVVDDHPAVRESLRLQLERIGCQVTVAINGEDALERFEPALFDMVLLDCQLTDIDGYTVAARLRAMEVEHGIHTPIIAISASTEPGHQERCVSSGMDGVLSKPVRLQQLMQMVDMWCGTEMSAEKASQSTSPLLIPNGIDLDALFQQALHDDLRMLKDSLRGPDWPGVARAAHRIMGAALTVSHEEIVSAASLIEAVARTCSTGDSAHADRERLQDIVSRIEHASLDLGRGRR